MGGAHLRPPGGLVQFEALRCFDKRFQEAAHLAEAWLLSNSARCQAQTGSCACPRLHKPPARSRQIRNGIMPLADFTGKLQPIDANAEAAK